jgi:hypothetical protein
LNPDRIVIVFGFAEEFFLFPPQQHPFASLLLSGGLGSPAGVKDLT